MEKEAYQQMYAAEEQDWWYRGKHELMLSFVAKIAGRRGKRLQIADVGCGTGIFVKKLMQYGTVVGIDNSREAISFCRKRGLKNVMLGSAMKLPFPSGSKDIITFADLLYHRDVDDGEALKEAYRVLRKGGHVIINDSAMPILISRHDEAVHGARRYTQTTLRRKLHQAGFTVEKMSYFNATVFPAVLVMRKIDNIISRDKLPKLHLTKTAKPLNKVLTVILRAESRAIQHMHISLPFGVSIFAVARKR